MPVVRFPDPRTDHPDGLVATGGDLHPETLLLAYRQGIFPWPHPGYPLLWFSPPERGVIDFDGLHLGRTVRRLRRQSTLRFTIDAAFPAVMQGCALMPRGDQMGTWITDAMYAAYVRMHDLGVAHSAEAWRGDELVGGVYGIDVDGAFAAESMFRREPNASKLALLHLIDHLAARGLDWLDVQVLTPHVANLGGRAVPRDVFLERLAATRARGLRLFD
jgi:leucyl/phenylalanyl-tRNA---protein transferase